MKNKNLILGIFILGIVFMSSFAFAGITGYVLRGQALSSDGVSATLKSVDRFGTVTVAVEDTKTGIVETVQVKEGGTAITSRGDVVTARDFRRKSLFRKEAAEINVQSPVAGIAAGSGISTGHTHLSDFKYITKTLNAQYFSNGVLGSNIPQNVFDGIINCVSEMGTSEVIALSGGYKITWNDPFNGKGEVITQENGQVYNTEKAYAVSVVDPRADDLASVEMVTLCARVEPTLHQFSQDY
ncbi:MAG: hypothetical protein QT10_C0004G0045 [archaeon GW2011_AR19]|nr:MAG: hypothetical protein QT10_C0004G0045 [archaeon GW2011_AR19]